MSFLALLIGTLCTWRITHLIAAEDGPWQIVARLRRHAGAGFWGALMDCFNCLSLWMAAPFAWLLGDRWLDKALLWLACSGGAVLLERVTSRERNDEAASWVEHPQSSKGANDGVLWRSESAREPDGDRDHTRH
jgi:hypothetical protein